MTICSRDDQKAVPMDALLLDSQWHCHHHGLISHCLMSLSTDSLYKLGASIWQTLVPMTGIDSGLGDSCPLLSESTQKFLPFVTCWVTRNNHSEQFVEYLYTHMSVKWSGNGSVATNFGGLLSNCLMVSVSLSFFFNINKSTLYKNCNQHP